MDTLAQTANETAQAAKSAQSNSEEQNGDSSSRGEGQPDDSQSVISQEETSEQTQVLGATRPLSFLAYAGKCEVASIANPAPANINENLAERSAPSQAQTKPARPDNGRDSNSIQRGADQGLSQQLMIAQPAITPTEIAGSDLLGEQAFSRGFFALESSPAGSQAMRAAAQQIATEEPADSTSVQPIETASSSGASRNSRITAAEITLPFEMASTSTFTEGSFLPKGDDASISTSRLNPAKTISSNGAGDAPDGASGTAGEPAKSSTKQESSPAQHAGQSDGQSSTQAQAASGQLTPAAAKISDAITQVAGFAAHTTSESTPAGHAVSGDAADVPSHGQAGGELPAERVSDANGAGSADLNTARLVQSMSQSEMRLGMHSAEFGEISVRASVTPQQVQAQIEVDHSELGNAISAHIPSLQAKLGSDFGLHASIEVSQPGTSHHHGQGHTQQQQQNLSANRALAGETAQAADTDTQMPASLLRAVDDGRLDIRA